MGRSFGVALVLALAAGCGEPARRLGSGPAGDAGARALVEALTPRFGDMEREPAFDALRPKLARAAHIPWWVWDDEAGWPRQGEGFPRAAPRASVSSSETETRQSGSAAGSARAAFTAGAASG